MISTFIRADRLYLASLFQSKEEARYYLNGVFIEGGGNGGARIVATNGHHMAVFSDDAGFTRTPCIIPLPKAAAAVVKSHKRRDFLWFALIGEHDGAGRRMGVIFDTEKYGAPLPEVREMMEDPLHPGVIWSGAIDLIDGTFPDWRAVIPASVKAAGLTGAINADLMKPFREVAVIAKGSPAAIRVYHNGEGPAVVTCGRQDFIGVIMPMRSDEAVLTGNGPVLSLPDWISEAA